MNSNTPIKQTEKNEIIITQNDIAEKDLPAINALLKQLSDNATVVTFPQIEKVRQHSIIFTARNNQNRQILGMATLAKAYKLRATHGYGLFEDFVVDASARGQRVGFRLFQAALNEAIQLNMQYVEWTSNPTKPSRAGAIKLYENYSGCQKRNTNVYRFVCKK